MRLDVGCGSAFQGDVNVDVKRPCDVMCSVDALPFQRVFSVVSMSHVLEHLDDPVKALDECLRVARIVEVRVPVRWHPYTKLDKSHKWHFSSEWFKRYAESRGLKVQGKQQLSTDRSFFLFPIELCIHLYRS